jgi:hypothetical protein
VPSACNRRCNERRFCANSRAIWAVESAPATTIVRSARRTLSEKVRSLSASRSLSSRNRTDCSTGSRPLIGSSSHRAGIDKLTRRRGPTLLILARTAP